MRFYECLGATKRRWARLSAVMSGSVLSACIPALGDSDGVQTPYAGSGPVPQGGVNIQICTRSGSTGDCNQSATNTNVTQAAETEGSEGAPPPPPPQAVQRPDCHGIMNTYLAGHPEESRGVVMKRAVWFYLPLTEKHVCDIKTVRANGTYGRFALSEKAYRVNREALLLVEQEAAWAAYGNMSDESAEILRKMPPNQEIEVAIWPSENIPVSTYDTTSGSAFEQSAFRAREPHFAGAQPGSGKSADARAYIHTAERERPHRHHKGVRARLAGSAFCPRFRVDLPGGGRGTRFAGTDCG